MKRGYLEIGLVVLFLDFFCKNQVAMARHAHPSCLRCPIGYGVSRPCSRSRVTECEPCPAGRSYSSHASAHRPCYPCSRCGTGLYVAHLCTPERDTVCDSCHTYKGPHNADFFERCIQPLQQHNHTESSQSSVDKRLPSSSGSSALLIGAGSAAGALAVVLLVTSITFYSRRRCKRQTERLIGYVPIEQLVNLSG
ncbi:tumor necrosis factor receptor superfamily member 16-like [Uloborus diversus]|uniref:tumor necrosis factor receptor superfamily member 16-like n=1 Tax=Uloborus diversus TaxID=327109 RepID=UPI00240A213B|nr:tumor necrosis factor receptor superfamily member 16-like [Uloborus diversus]